MYTSSPEFSQALWDCPQMLGRVQVLITPDRYTLGEVELLRMLGVDAGRELDWDDWPDPHEMAEIRNPRVTVPWSEELYGSQTCTLAEWVMAEALFGGTYGSVGMCMDEVTDDFWAYESADEGVYEDEEVAA